MKLDVHLVKEGDSKQPELRVRRKSGCAGMRITGVVMALAGLWAVAEVRGMGQDVPAAPPAVPGQSSPGLTSPGLTSPGLQTPVTQAPVRQAPTGGLTVNPAVSLRDFESNGNEAYELGRGDEISIDVGGRPEMSSKHIIGPDGKITLPLVGSVNVADKTREEAGKVIEAAYAPFYSTLTVTVGVDRYTSNQVLLLGAVEHPGILTFDRPPTLLEVVTRGGSVTGSRSIPATQSNGSSYNLQGSLLPSVFGVPERCAIYRGNDKVLWVDLKSLLDSGSPLADIRLKRDDIVYVPSPSERYVSVLGQVQHPGALQLDSTSTLAQLVALAGGLTPQAGRYPDIQIIQPSTGKTRVISFKQVLQPGSLDLTLKSGDIIYVPENGFNRAAYVLEKISPLVTLFTATAFFAR